MAWLEQKTTYTPHKIRTDANRHEALAEKRRRGIRRLSPGTPEVRNRHARPAGTQVVFSALVRRSSSTIKNLWDCTLPARASPHAAQSETRRWNRRFGVLILEDDMRDVDG